MNSNFNSLKVRMLAVYCALGYVVLVFGGMIVAGFLPPPSAADSATQIASLFASHTLTIRLGMLLIMWSSLVFMPFAAVAAYYVGRVEGGFGVLAMTTLLGGAGNMVLTFYPGIWWMDAAFRPDRLADAVYVINDGAWTQLIGGVSMYAAMPISVAIAALMDKSPNPILPRWFGFVNMFLVLIILPDQALFFFHVGPFAWNGLFAFWIPIGAFGGWFISMFFVLRLAVLRDKGLQHEGAPAGFLQAGR